MREAYGVPVVERAEDLMPTFAALGIQPWRETSEPMDLDAYRSMLENPPISRGRTSDPDEDRRRQEGHRQDAERLAELQRFAPKGQAMFLETPNGRPFTGFRSVGRDWATVFALLPDPTNPNNPERSLLPVAGEWKHGAEVITIGPPCGVPKRGKPGEPDEPMEACGAREFTEETGFAVDQLIKLTPKPVAVSGRQTTQKWVGYLGHVPRPIVRGPSRLDATEDLKMALIPLSAWMDAIEQGLVLESSSIAVTCLALRKLGMLSFGIPVVAESP